VNVYYVANFFSILCAKYCRNQPTFAETTVQQKCGHFLDHGVVCLRTSPFLAGGLQFIR